MAPQGEAPHHARGVVAVEEVVGVRVARPRGGHGEPGTGGGVGALHADAGACCCVCVGGGREGIQGKEYLNIEWTSTL